MAKTKIITYHFIKDEKDIFYKNIVGLKRSEFKKQIYFLKKNYSIISMEELIYNFSKNITPKKPSVVLTFDDGYKCHYDIVYPILKKEKISGAFYPTKFTLEQKGLLSVNKIHLLLAKLKNKKKFKLEILDFFNEKEILFYQKKLKKIFLKNSRKHTMFYDDQDTLACKFLLQYLIPEFKRNQIMDTLCHKYIKIDNKSLIKKFYLNKNNAKEMIQNGMHFGSHGNNHDYWWEYLSEKKQNLEIKSSKACLVKLGVKKENFTICYPWGSYNKSTIKILKKCGCKIGLTTKYGIIKNPRINSLTLPRVDTNEIKQEYIQKKLK